MARSQARQAAMSLLYERLSGGDADEDSLNLIYEQMTEAQTEGKELLAPTRDENRYIQEVLEGVKEHQAEIDETIAAHSTGSWTIDRVAHVDLSILRLAAYEILYRTDVPMNVAISEAMNMADRYSDPKSSRYINAVLGAIGRSKGESNA